MLYRKTSLLKPLQKKKKKVTAAEGWIVQMLPQHLTKQEFLLRSLSTVVATPTNQ